MQNSFFLLTDFVSLKYFYHSSIGKIGIILPGERAAYFVLIALLFLTILCLYFFKQLRQNAQEIAALKFNAGRYRAVVEQSEDGFALVEPETMRILECNEALVRLLGYDSVEEIKSLTAYDFNADEKWRDKYSVKQNGSQKRFYSGEKNYRRRNGELVQVEATATPIIFNNSKVYSMNVKDITERKRAEEKLVRLAIVAQKTQNAVIITDAEGYIQWVNEGFTKLTGYEYDEVVGNLGYLLQGEKTDAETVELIRTTMWARQPFSAEIYNYTKDGDGFWMSISITPTYNDKGEVEGFIAVQMDVTERKAMEEQLIRAQSELENRVAERTAELSKSNQALKVEISERLRAEVELDNAQQFLRKVIDSMPNVIFVKDREGRFTLANKSLAEIYGTTTDEIVGKCDADFSQDLDRIKQVANDEHQIMENLEEKIVHEEKIIDAAGNIHWYQTVKRPMVFSDGVSRHVLGIATDLTDRKNLENKLRHAQKMESIGQLAAGIAHEINTPTQYVGDNTNFVREGFTEVSEILSECRQLIGKINAGKFDLEEVKQIEEKLKENDIEYLIDEIPKAIESALEGVSRISKIVASMRTFSHPGTFEKKPADINKAIESTVAVAHNEWKYVADLETDFDENLPPVMCLLDEINQVVLNMVVNASHSIADVVEETNHGKGKITISTKRADNEWAEIRIKDTGAGIPNEAQDRIFDPFFTTKAVGKGTGQGLAISHNVIVEKHGGQLTFETAPNCGTTFIIRLPLQNQISNVVLN